MRYLKVMVNGQQNGEPERCAMTSIHVCLPEGLAFAHAKAYALAHITQELTRYGPDEALRGVGINPEDK